MSSTHTTTADRLDRLTQRIQASINVCSEQKKRKVLSQELSGLHAAIASEVADLAQNQKRKFVQVRKDLVVISNVVSGLLEGLAADELTLKSFRSQIDNLTGKFFPRLCESLSKEVEAQEAASEEPQVTLSAQQKKVKKTLVSASGQDLKDALLVIKKKLQEQRQEQKRAVPAGRNAPAAAAPVDPVAEQIVQLQESYSDLPRAIRGEFQLVRLPIIPIFSNHNLNSQENFKRLGINFIDLEGYAILLNQVVVMVSGRKAAGHSMTPLEYAESVLALLNERGSTNYNFVSDQFAINPRNKDIHMFWAMPTNKMNILLSIARQGRKASTVRWGLAFDPKQQG